jgi:hypothetical protein
MSRNAGNPARGSFRHTARTVLVWCLALTAGAPFAQRAMAQDQTDTPDVPAGFVTIVNGEFQVDGRQFRHVGVNTPGLVYESNAEALVDLDGMRGAGIKQVRVFLPNNQLTPNQVGDRLQWLLDRAWERGIRVTLPLTDYYGGKIWAGGLGGNARHLVRGDDVYYTICIANCGDPNNRITVLDQNWFNGGYTANYLPFVRYIVGRFAYHPAVFAWEVANEARNDPYSSAKAFYTRMVTEIKALDPNHLVAPGIISTNWLGLTNDADRDAFYRDTRLDYVTIHSGGGNDSHRELLDVPVARRLGKPLVVEETGMNSLCSSIQPYMPFDYFDRMKQYYYQLYNNSDKPASAMLLWAVEWGPHGSGDNCQGPREQGRLADYEGLWREWAGRLSGAPAASETLRAAADCNNIFFNWEGAEGATGYFVDIADTYSDLVNMQGTFRNFYVGTQRSLNVGGLQPYHDYYWRVWGFNGQTGTHGYPVPQTVRTCTNGAATGVAYRAHVQNYGWGSWARDWADAGTIGQSLRVEALQIRLTNSPITTRLCYQGHIEGMGDQELPAVCDVQEPRAFMRRYAGTNGQSRRMEAVRIWLEGAPPGMSVVYQAHVQNIGWMSEVSNGQWAGTRGQFLRLEALRVRIVRSAEAETPSPTPASDGN